MPTPSFEQHLRATRCLSPLPPNPLVLLVACPGCCCCVAKRWSRSSSSSGSRRRAGRARGWRGDCPCAALGAPAGQLRLPHHGRAQRRLFGPLAVSFFFFGVLPSLVRDAEVQLSFIRAGCFPRSHDCVWFALHTLVRVSWKKARTYFKYVRFCGRFSRLL